MKKPATLRELNGLTQGCRVIYDDQGKKLFGIITISADTPERRVHGVCGVTYDTVALDNVSETDANDTLEYMLCCQSGEFLSD